MNSKTARRLAPAFMVAAFALTATPPASAAEFFLPKGLGCADFNLKITTTGGNLHTKEWLDESGNVVRSITAGKGVDLTYTNFGPDPDNPVAGKSVTIKTAGSVTKTVRNPDGTLTVRYSGHNGLVLFPSDVPAGPTTTQYVGTVVANIDPATGVFTLISTAGQQRDICAELAG
jgi:hypothetical protein